MVTQLIIGSFIICLNVFIHIGFVQVWGRILHFFVADILRYFDRLALHWSLAFSSLWLLLALTIEVWLWAFTYIAIGALTELEEAVYFSLVAFTTLGYGDITLPKDYRILSGLTAVNGMLMFGMTTAFLVEIYLRLTAIRNQNNQHRPPPPSP